MRNLRTAVALNADLDDLLFQLDQALVGGLDFRLYSAAEDERVRGLARRINVVLETAQKAIADLRQEHRDLEASERRYRDYLTYSPYGIFVANEQGRLLEVNPAACLTTGYSEAELLDMEVADLGFPEDREPARQSVRVVFTTGRYEAETAYRTKSGERRWWFVRSVKLSDTRIIGFCHDISVRKRAELALRESQAVLSEVLNAIPVRVFWKSTDLRILGCNTAFARDAGFEDAEQLIGQDDYAMAWREQAELYRADDRAVIESGEARLLIEEPQTTPTGERIYLLTSKVPLRDAEGRIVGVLGTYHDITPLRRAEAEQRRLEEQLRQSQKLQAVGRLAAGIAHEINTPAQFVGDSVQFLAQSQAALQELIAGYRETLAPLLADPAQVATRERIAALETAADIDFLLENAPAALNDALDGVVRITGIVRAMKEFAHPGHAEKAPADLNHALETTLTIARNEYKYVADVETDFGELPLVNCHLGELNQVFLNLIVNAAQAIGEFIGKTGGRGQIRLRTRQDGDWARIEIADTGGGIPQAIQERVFEPFFTTKPAGKGSGQGLAIAHATIVNKHGGELSFNCEQGKGTTFVIRLPFKTESPAAAPAAPEVN